MNALRVLIAPTLLAVAIVVLEWVWVAAPVMRTESPLPLPKESWLLPPPFQPDLAIAMEQLDKRLPWGKHVITAPAAPADPPWRFLGMTARGSDRIVILKRDGEPEQWLRAGDKLPGGSQILEINQESLCILIENKRRQLPLRSGHAATDTAAPAERATARPGSAAQARPPVYNPAPVPAARAAAIPPRPTRAQPRRP